MARLRLTVLGSFDARLDGGRSLVFSRRKAQALLAYLALAHGQAQPRDKLAALLWGDVSDDRARKSLRQVLVELRRLGGGPRSSPLVERGDTVALDPTMIDVDADDFERLARTDSVSALADAAARYGGDLLAGLNVQERPFEEWLLTERERLRELAIDVLAKLLAHHAEHGELEPAIQCGVKLLGLDPTQEVVHRTLMRLYAQQGRRGAALRQYQVCVALLGRELDAPPEPETRELYQQLLRTHPVPAAAPADARGLRAPDAMASVAPLIGREEELVRLGEARVAAWAGEGTVLSVVGEAGIGKSRLIGALAADAAHAGGHVLIGRAWDTERILPFGPWVDAIRSAQIVPDLIDDLGAHWRAELARLFPELGPPPADFASNDHLRLFEAMSRVVEHLAARHPLLLVLEDLHWADEMSLRLLSFVARRVVARPVLLAVTAREEELAGAPMLRRVLAELERHPRVRTITLSRLSETQTESLLRALSPTASDEVTIRARAADVWRVSGGNPFVAVETFRAIRDGEVLAGPSETSAPARAREVIASRLDAGTETARRLAEVAAVIGREFEFELVVVAAGVNAGEGARGIEELVGRAMLHAVGERFDFTHDVIRETAYARLSPPRRALLHRAVAEAIETIHAANLAPHALALGRHGFESRDWERASTYLVAAGRAAAERSAHREAVACFEQAITALEQLPSTRAWMERAVDVRYDARNSLHTLGELTRMLEILREAEALARALDDRRRLANAEALLTHCLSMLGRHEEAVTCGRRAHAALVDAEPMVRIPADFYLAQTFYFRGDYTTADALLTGTVAALTGDLAYARFGFPTAWSIVARTFLALCLAERGHFDDAIAHGQAILAQAEQHREPWGIFHASLALGRSHALRGEFARAADILRHGLVVCHERELVLGAVTLGSLFAHALASGGRLDEAVEVANAQAERTLLPHLLCLVGDTYRIAGRTADAAPFLARGLELCAGRGERGFEGWAHLLCGQLAASADPIQEAVALRHFEHAQRLGDACGMRPLVAQAHLNRGELHMRSGRHAEGAVDLSRAGAIFEATGMTAWRRRAALALSPSA